MGRIGLARLLRQHGRIRFVLPWSMGLVLLPPLVLLSYWGGGRLGLTIAAIILPLSLVFLPWHRRHGVGQSANLLGAARFSGESQLFERLAAVLQDAAGSGRSGACFVIYLDDAPRLIDLHGRMVFDRILARTGTRLMAGLREGDMVARIEGDGFAIAIPAMRQFDLEAAVQLAVRLQVACAAGVTDGEFTLHPSVSIGFCLSARAPAPVARGWLDAAKVAAQEAQAHGPGAIRAFQAEMLRHRADRAELRAGLAKALETGQIRPWFQPQLCTDTGEVSGFEALARWHHPERGVIAPADFLPLVEDVGLSARLGEVILYGTLTALQRWDKAGHKVPRVSLNFSASELRNPQLAERLRWELDRFELAPQRLTIEVLETVAARAEDDAIIHNLAKIAELGCGIDLDDFGTGQASIANIRRFAVRRIKIDRCFVTHVDSDPEQKKMVAAILSLCERLELETIAEGVETPGEHTTMAQLGCDHVQGYGIARPMTMEQSFGWLARHEQGGVRNLRLT